ncbi:hypothetical protein Pmar_PMAR010140 [Perkinsus marinus ATCC 50983]|uniref:Uncharacterized protein n=1 Tax=Perkinsus marinus (strain ATCC 50983 / TXsc) TaxID=423536 RepID=C5K4Y4_PERM5|nr:hypothetical protein Pmar_PMAR010140 [Perkinsus marinus ATCC 50983]EER20406.1 hypothetical protein Pmar_PMAR010140 [Perkinsus marinus ATCC 50983]|eukprot:XP_002788610.1 hypothetical protein Pmar_PMAR010140 [Perkinsus marinus ATCC 50983]
MSFRDSPEPRRVDLAGMFGCLADAGDAGVMALESELTTCMKEADECLEDILAEIPSWLESRGVPIPSKPSVMTAPLLHHHKGRSATTQYSTSGTSRRYYLLHSSVKRQMQRGYFPDATPGGVDDPPTPVWAKGRKSIAEMMETNDDNVSPIAGQKGGGMDLDHIPAWSLEWKSMVLAQSNTDPDSIFGDRIPGCDIGQIFGDIVASGQLDPPNTQSFKDYIRINDKTGRRGSTGNWRFDELLDEEIYTYKQKMKQNIKAGST